MITLLASLSGFLGALFPHCMQLLQQHREHQYRLELLHQQMELQRITGESQADTMRIIMEMQETRNLHQSYYTGVRWVDALNGTVRPLLAYGFFLLYGGMKWLQFCGTSPDTPLLLRYETVWNVEDHAIFASIVSFYFGQRTFHKMQAARERGTLRSRGGHGS